MTNGLWLDVYRTGREVDLPPPALNANLPEIYFATDTRRFFLRVGDTWTHLTAADFGLANLNNAVTALPNGNVGVGVSPGFRFHVRGADGVADTLATVDNFAASGIGAGFVGRRARGTAASPTAVQNFDVLALMGARGHDGTSFTADRCRVVFQAQQNFTSGAQGTRIIFANTALGANTLSDRLIIAADGAITPGADGTQNLGFAGGRYSTVFAVTGTINTSDEREKEWRGPLNEAELRVAKRIETEIGIYQFLSAIEEKGEDARLHCGVRAQRVFAILEDEGLEWQRYAWCCYDKWDDQIKVDEDGNEVVVRKAGDRYGLRTDELLLWLVSAQGQRIAALEKGVKRT